MAKKRATKNKAVKVAFEAFTTKRILILAIAVVPSAILLGWSVKVMQVKKVDHNMRQQLAGEVNSHDRHADQREPTDMKVPIATPSASVEDNSNEPQEVMADPIGGASVNMHMKSPRISDASSNTPAFAELPQANTISELGKPSQVQEEPHEDFNGNLASIGPHKTLHVDVQLPGDLASVSPRGADALLEEEEDTPDGALLENEDDLDGIADERSLLAMTCPRKLGENAPPEWSTRQRSNAKTNALWIALDLAKMLRASRA